MMMAQLGLQTHSSLLTATQDTDSGGMGTNMAAQLQLQLDLKAEKKVSKRFWDMEILCVFYVAKDECLERFRIEFVNI